MIITTDTNFIITPSADSGFVLHLDIDCIVDTEILYSFAMICEINLGITLIFFIVEQIIPLLIERKSFS